MDMVEFRCTYIFYPSVIVIFYNYNLKHFSGRGKKEGKSMLQLFSLSSVCCLLFMSNAFFLRATHPKQLFGTVQLAYSSSVLQHIHV
jgi:hypothetical protein